ncbi:hypothetical protein [Chitinophaga silvatica]|nr:hypothetical protein [Chitinophaga silvatica]
MSWNRRYHFFLLFGDTKGENAPWNKEVWRNDVFPKLDILFKQSSFYNKIGVGSLQYSPKPDSQYYEPVKLGRLSWNSPEKWTLNTSTPIRFHHLDVWAPSRGACEKLNSSPDVYLSICNERDALNLTTTAFEWLTVLAVATEIQGDVMSKVIALSKALNAKKTVHIERGWEQKLDDTNWSLVNSIQDTFSFGIYKGDDRSLHEIQFENIEFSPFWNIIFER